MSTRGSELIEKWRGTQQVLKKIIVLKKAQLLWETYQSWLFAQISKWV